MARHGSHARLRPLGVAVVDVGSVGEGDVSRRRRRPGRILCRASPPPPSPLPPASRLADDRARGDGGRGGGRRGTAAGRDTSSARARFNSAVARARPRFPRARGRAAHLLLFALLKALCGSRFRVARYRRRSDRPATRLSAAHRSETALRLAPFSAATRARRARPRAQRLVSAGPLSVRVSPRRPRALHGSHASATGASPSVTAYWSGSAVSTVALAVKAAKRAVPPPGVTPTK